MPTLLARAERIRACVIDVMDHGVNLIEIGDRALWGFIGQNRDYFHSMLGYEPPDKEIFHLVRRVSAISPVDEAYMVLAEMRSRKDHRPPPIRRHAGRLAAVDLREAGDLREAADRPGPTAPAAPAGARPLSPVPASLHRPPQYPLMLN
ncbi:MAG TPA: hypothetical protein VER17_03090 [Tepidisphaeraceae bacterium]|nr:hypothetical protein [Tepidisphaeraceae bacterium]